MSVFPIDEKPPTGADSLPEAAAYEHLKDTMGRFRTQSLFVEHKHESYPAPFTLKPYDHRGAKSMYILYMDAGDPTEYTQAIAMLGSWRHWTILTNTQWFKPIVMEWRDELKVKFESDRYREMVSVTEECKGTPQGVSATKWLAERYSKVSKPKRGRPSKIEKAASLQHDKEEDALVAEEAQRLSTL